MNSSVVGKDESVANGLCRQVEAGLSDDAGVLRSVYLQAILMLYIFTFFHLHYYLASSKV